MSWEIATVILGLLATVTVSVVKFVPSRSGNGIEKRVRTLEQDCVSIATEMKNMHEDLREVKTDVRTILMELRQGS